MVDVKEMVARGMFTSLARTGVPGTKDLYYLETSSSLRHYCANHEKYVHPATLVMPNGFPVEVCEECLWDEDEANLEEAKPTAEVRLCGNPGCSKRAARRCVMCKMDVCEDHLVYSTICTDCNEQEQPGCC